MFPRSINQITIWLQLILSSKLQTMHKTLSHSYVDSHVQIAFRSLWAPNCRLVPHSWSFTLPALLKLLFLLPYFFNSCSGFTHTHTGFSIIFSHFHQFLAIGSSACPIHTIILLSLPFTRFILCTIWMWFLFAYEFNPIDFMLSQHQFHHFKLLFLNANHFRSFE